MILRASLFTYVGVACGAAHFVGKSAPCRAPVLTLWVTIVAEREGFSSAEALSYGRYVAGMFAQVCSCEPPSSRSERGY